MFYRRKMSLVAVDEYCGYCSTVNINAKDSITVWNALIKIRSRIMSFNPNFKIKKIKSDRDSAFNAIEDKLGELGIRLHRSEADGHDGMIERYIRSIKQVARSIEISISYTIHPDMIVPLIEHASQCENNAKKWSWVPSRFLVANPICVDFLKSNLNIKLHK